MTNHSDSHSTEEFIAQVYTTLKDVSKYLTSVSAPTSATTSPTISPAAPSYLYNGVGYDVGDLTLGAEIQTKVSSLLEAIEHKFPNAIKQGSHHDNNSVILPSLRNSGIQEEASLTSNDHNSTTTTKSAPAGRHLKKTGSDKVGMSISAFLKSKMPKKTSSPSSSPGNSWNKVSPSSSPGNSYNSNSFNNLHVNVTNNNNEVNSPTTADINVHQYYTIQPQTSAQRKHSDAAAKHERERHTKFLRSISKLKKEKVEEVTSTPATPTEMNQRNMHKLINFFGDAPIATTTTTSSSSSSPSSNSNNTHSVSSSSSTSSTKKATSPNSSALRHHGHLRRSSLRRSKSYNL